MCVGLHLHLGYIDPPVFDRRWFARQGSLGRGEEILVEREFQTLARIGALLRWSRRIRIQFLNGRRSGRDQNVEGRHILLRITEVLLCVPLSAVSYGIESFEDGCWS